MGTEQLIIVKTQKQLDELVEYIKDKEYIAFDTETTGTDKESKIIGFSVCAEEAKAFYVITYYWDPKLCKLIDTPLKGPSKKVIEALKGRSLIMHNGVFDCFMVENNYGISLIKDLHTDTMILGHLLDENRSNGLKELGVSLFDLDAKKEQAEMQASVLKNGGQLTKKCYELYKADPDLIAKYGAKDTILTFKVAGALIPELIEQGLDKFFYEDESMPLLRGPTYDLNTVGLRIDPEKLQKVKGELETEIMEDEAYIYKEIEPLVKDEYPGTNKKNTFNLNSPTQKTWLLFHKLENEFNILTNGGRELCKALEIKIPYSPSAKRAFIQTITERKGETYAVKKWNNKKKVMETKNKEVEDYWKYLQCGKVTLGKLSLKYKWVERFLKYAKNKKLLNTYIEGIQDRMKYNIIRPSFLQHGTTSGRYSSKAPNFQNLPRKDKRIKSFIVSRPGKVFVGADFSQLEPRVFASFSGDERLLKAFSSGEDFYSTIGMEVFNKRNCTPYKEGDPNAFGVKYPKERDSAKVVALSAAYGTTPFKMSGELKCSTEEARKVIDDYFTKYPKVLSLMLESHEMAKRDGAVYNLFGRPRRMPEAKEITKVYGNLPHEELPYEARNILNLSINHRIQSTGASIMNRSAIAFYEICREMEAIDPAWAEVKIILQVHDELIVEGPEHLAEDISVALKHSMENTVKLPGVSLEAVPKIAKNLADLK